jgi:hypothetical protein
VLRNLRLAALSLLLAAIVLTGAGCSLLPSHRSVTRQETVGTTNVTAPVTGDLAGEVLAALPAIDIIQPLAAPIKLAVKGGELDGHATLSTPVPDNLPHGIKPEMVGYLTKVEPSGEWLWVGGDYHPDTRTVTIETSHFSEWILGATNPEQILADLQEINYKSFISKPLFDTMYGDIPKLSCSRTRALPKKAADVKPLVDVLISDTLPPEVKACMGLGKDGKFELEIVNSHSMPLRLDLPKGVNVKHELLGDEGFMQIAASYMREKVSNDVILYQESKLRFSVDPAELSDNPVITGQLDTATFLFNTSMWMTEVIVRGRALERAEGRNDPDSIERGYEEYAAKALDYGGDAECVRRKAKEMQDDGRKVDFANLARQYQAEVIEECVAHKVVAEAASRMEKYVKQPLNRLAKAGGELLDWGADFIKSSMAQARSEIEVFMYLGARSAGWVQTYELKVKLTRDVHFEHALPAIGESVFGKPKYLVDDQGNPLTDTRRLVGDVQFWVDDMMPPDCTHGARFHTDWVDGSRLAMGVYAISDNDEDWFMLVPIKRGDGIKVESHLYSTKRKCYFDQTHKNAGDLFKLATEPAGQTTLSYRVNSPTDVFYRKWAYSNGYMLVGTVGGSDARAQRLLEKAFKYAGQRVDDSFLGTQFKR